MQIRIGDTFDPRVIALLDDGASGPLNALLQRAGLPETTRPAFRAALVARQDVGFVDSWIGVVRLRRHMVERVMTICEQDVDASEPLMILLRRFATESAREDARAFCEELAIEDTMAPYLRELAAA